MQYSSTHTVSDMSHWSWFRQGQVLTDCSLFPSVLTHKTISCFCCPCPTEEHQHSPASWLWSRTVLTDSHFSHLVWVYPFSSGHEDKVPASLFVKKNKKKQTKKSRKELSGQLAGQQPVISHPWHDHGPSQKENSGSNREPDWLRPRVLDRFLHFLSPVLCFYFYFFWLNRVPSWRLHLYFCMCQTAAVQTKHTFLQKGIMTLLYQM